MLPERSLDEVYAVSSPTPTSMPFRPNSRRERLEWAAARLKERLSPHPQYANYTDADWIGMAPLDSGWMHMPVLDPTCKVRMPQDHQPQARFAARLISGVRQQDEAN
jgi:hypothetical protein